MQIKDIYGYPNLEELYLNSNPLERVHPKATTQIKLLQIIDLRKCQFKNAHPDELKFLRHLTNLQRLDLSNCFAEADCKDLSIIPGVFTVENLSLGGIGLLNISGIEKKFPILRTLDLKANKIFSVDAVDTLYYLKKLRIVNFEHCPIMMHIHFNQLVQDAAPQVEVVNGHPIREIGSRTK